MPQEHPYSSSSSSSSSLPDLNEATPSSSSSSSSFLTDEETLAPKIVVVGVGGGGCNAGTRYVICITPLLTHTDVPSLYSEQHDFQRTFRYVVSRHLIHERYKELST